VTNQQALVIAADGNPSIGNGLTDACCRFPQKKRSMASPREDPLNWRAACVA
jgi:hypothetical protein